MALATSNPAPVEAAPGSPAGPPTREQERAMFERMWTAATDAERIAARNAIVEVNMPSVGAALKLLQRGRRVDSATYDEITSEAYIVLIGAVEQFRLVERPDGQGYVRFFTFLMRCIARRLWALRKQARLDRRRIPIVADVTEDDGLLSFDPRRDDDRTHLIEQLRDILANNRARLTRREKKVIRQRYYERTPIKRIAAGYGVAVKTIRAWCCRVFAKLRTALEWRAFRHRVNVDAIARRMKRHRERYLNGGNRRWSAFGVWLMRRARQTGITSYMALADALDMSLRGTAKMLKRTAPRLNVATKQALRRVLGIDEAELTNWSAA